MIKRVVHLAHGEFLDHWGDGVACAELKHGGHRGRGSERGAGYRFPAHDQGKRLDGDWLEHSADKVKAAVGLERGDVSVPIEGNIDRVENEIERTTDFFEF